MEMQEAEDHIISNSIILTVAATKEVATEEAKEAKEATIATIIAATAEMVVVANSSKLCSLHCRQLRT